MKVENCPRRRKAAPSRNSPAVLLHQKRQERARRQSSPVLHGELGQLDRREADQPAPPDRIANGKNKCSESRSGSRACQQSSEGIYPSLRDSTSHSYQIFFFYFKCSAITLNKPQDHRRLCLDRDAIGALTIAWRAWHFSAMSMQRKSKSCTV